MCDNPLAGPASSKDDQGEDSNGMADGRSLSTTCDSELADAVRARVAAERARELEWWDAELNTVRDIEDPEARMQARGALEDERRRRRDAGEFLASRDALLRRHLPAVLAANDWDREFPPIPRGVASIPGRRTGVPLRSGRTGDGEGRLAVNLPADLWEQIRRAAYWTSDPHVRELQAWHKRYGDGPGAAERVAGPVAGALVKMAVHQPTQTALERREELRGKVITTGDILRMAAKRATSL